MPWGTSFTGSGPTKASIAASMVAALSAQVPPLAQQLCDSSRRRTTRREAEVLSRLIFDLIAAYAVSIWSGVGLAPPSAKNGCCCAADVDEWQRTQFALAWLRTSR